jgi:hypothetical protein
LKLEQILRGAPVKLYGAGKAGLVKITFRQQVRSFVLKQLRLNKMISYAFGCFKAEFELFNISLRHAPSFSK